MYHSCIHCQRQMRHHPDELGWMCITSGCKWNKANVHFEDCSCDVCVDKTETIEQIRSFKDFQQEIRKVFNVSHKKLEYHMKAKKPKVASMRYDVQGDHPIGPRVDRKPIGMSSLFATVHELIIAGYEIRIRNDQIVER